MISSEKSAASRRVSAGFCRENPFSELRISSGNWRETIHKTLGISAGRAWAGIILSLLTAACDDQAVGRHPLHARTTYEKFLLQAAQGNADAQNLVGYMLFFGENVSEDIQEAHYWFHQAAEQEHPLAQRNLLIMHNQFRVGLLEPGETLATRSSSQAGGAEEAHALPDRIAAPGKVDSRKVSPGRSNYETFCSGCHGLNGIARYVESPSFAIGERMEKSDEQLLQSIAQGKGVMPGWESKISEPGMKQLLAYIRSFNDRYRTGIMATLRDAPELYFTFGPMADKPFGLEEGDTDDTPPPQ